MNLNRRAFLALLSAAPLASYVPIRSYFFAPKYGWRNNAVIQLYDAMGRTLVEKPFRLEADTRGYVNAGEVMFAPVGNWGELLTFGVSINGSKIIHGSFTYSKHVRNGDLVGIGDGALKVTFA